MGKYCLYFIQQFCSLRRCEEPIRRPDHCARRLQHGAVLALMILRFLESATADASHDLYQLCRLKLTRSGLDVQTHHCASASFRDSLRQTPFMTMLPLNIVVVIVLFNACILGSPGRERGSVPPPKLPMINCDGGVNILIRYLPEAAEWYG